MLIRAVLSLHGDGQPLLPLLPPLIDPLSELRSDEEPPLLVLFESDFLPRGRGELSGVFNISASTDGQYRLVKHGKKNGTRSDITFEGVQVGPDRDGEVCSGPQNL